MNHYTSGMAGNFGFRGPIGSSGLEFFVPFWGDAKKNMPAIARMLCPGTFPFLFISHLF
jgi:hypothetical protein